MAKKITAIIACLTVFFVIKLPVHANEFDLNTLVSNAKDYDQHLVTIQAEVIGEALERGSHTWININDTTNAIGVWAPTEMISQINIYGDYFHTGDVINVQGYFNHSCLEHGGEMDIHAIEIRVVKQGFSRKLPLNPWKFVFAIMLLTIAISMGLRYRSYLEMMRSKYKLHHFD